MDVPSPPLESNTVFIALLAALAGSIVTAVLMRRLHPPHLPNERYTKRRSGSAEFASAQDTCHNEQDTTTTTQCSDSDFFRNRPQDLRRPSDSSAESSLPSDAYFEQLDQDNEHNKSGTSEDIDRLSSLRTVRRSILNRKSLCPDEDIDYEEPSTSTLSDSTCSYQKMRRLSDYQRRRSLLRRFSRPRNSITDSVSTLDYDEDDPKTCDEDSYISETERHFTGREEGFDTIMELASDYSTTVHLLRRTRAISALAHRLIAAPDEAACIEEVTRLMALIFGLNRVSFAMSTGSDHFLLKRIEVKRRDVGGLDSLSNAAQHLFDLEFLDSDFKRPYEGTAAGIVAKTLREHYTPRTQFSHFATHKVFYKQGLNSVLASPILVNGNQCMGVILLSKREEDAFPKGDRILISDIGTLLGANIYAKRLRKASEDANKLSREMLHSFVPPKVLEKIEGFWDSSSEKYKKLKASTNSNSIQEDSEFSPESSVCNKSCSEEEITRSNSWFVANTDWSEARIQEHVSRLKQNVLEGKLQMLKKLNRGQSFNNDDVIITTQGLDLDAELNMTSKALYAETVHNVSIIFTDIVGFSRIAMGVTPIKVMNMLQNLFNRFDQLCDVHGVMKLETIGDAYLCATNLLEEDANNVDVARNAAIRALAMAKDMIREARNVHVPFSRKAVHVPWASHAFDDTERLEIRVGIHVGDITCGVLGQRLPKFTICGTTVNLAARMEQTSQPSHIRVTEDFHALIGDNEKGWLGKETIPIKNMGTVDTYLLDPDRSLLQSCLEI
jgi:class 3 adenylate cyclase